MQAPILHTRREEVQKANAPVSLVDDEVPPPDLVERRLLDVGDLVRGQQHVPVALVLRRSRLEIVPDDSGTLVLPATANRVSTNARRLVFNGIVRPDSTNEPPPRRSEQIERTRRLAPKDIVSGTTTQMHPKQGAGIVAVAIDIKGRIQNGVCRATLVAPSFQLSTAYDRLDQLERHGHEREPRLLWAPSVVRARSIRQN